MSEGGASAYEVAVLRRQVESLDSTVSGMGRTVSRLESVVNGLENEMANVEQAVREANRTFANGINQLVGQQSQSHAQLMEAQATTHKMTLQQFVAANTQLDTLKTVSATGFVSVTSGLGTVSSDLHVVDGSVQQMTRAVVQMEVIRLLNEAKGPLQRIQGFGEEIDQRFAKAVENIYFVRSQYDQLGSTAAVEYDRKLHLIGEHIYRIYEQDFRSFAELPLADPPERHVELPLAVDERQLAERSAALDVSLGELGDDVLSPLLTAQRDFEHKIASDYATAMTTPQGDLAIPAAVRIVDEGSGPRLEAFAATRAERCAAGEGGTGFTLRRAPFADGVTRAVEAAAPRVFSGMRARKLQAPELAQMKVALSDLVKGGYVEERLLQGYYDYLDQFGLEVIAEGEAR